LPNIGTSEMMLVTVKIRLIVKEMRRMMKLLMNHDDQYKALDNPIIFIDSVRRDSRSIVMFWNLTGKIVWKVKMLNLGMVLGYNLNICDYNLKIEIITLK
jgi:hypothetical protein